MTSYEQNRLCFCSMYQYNKKLESGFPPTTGQIPPTSGSYDWSNWDPHMAYIHCLPPSAPPGPRRHACMQQVTRICKYIVAFEMTTTSHCVSTLWLLPWLCQEDGVCLGGTGKGYSFQTSQMLLNRIFIPIVGEKTGVGDLYVTPGILYVVPLCCTKITLQKKYYCFSMRQCVMCSISRQ